MILRGSGGGRKQRTQDEREETGSSAPSSTSELFYASERVRKRVERVVDERGGRLEPGHRLSQDEGRAREDELELNEKEDCLPSSSIPSLELTELVDDDSHKSLQALRFHSHPLF